VQSSCPLGPFDARMSFLFQARRPRATVGPPVSQQSLRQPAQKRPRQDNHSVAAPSGKRRRVGSPLRAAAPKNQDQAAAGPLRVASPAAVARLAHRPGPTSTSLDLGQGLRGPRAVASEIKQSRAVASKIKQSQHRTTSVASAAAVAAVAAVDEDEDEEMAMEDLLHAFRDDDPREFQLDEPELSMGPWQPE